MVELKTPVPKILVVLKFFHTKMRISYNQKESETKEYAPAFDYLSEWFHFFCRWQICETRGTGETSSGLTTFRSFHFHENVHQKQ